MVLVRFVSIKSPLRWCSWGGGEKTKGNDPSFGDANGALKVVKMGEWSVPSGPGVLPIENLYCLGPPIISKVAAFAYITSIRDLESSVSVRIREAWASAWCWLMMSRFLMLSFWFCVRGLFHV